MVTTKVIARGSSHSGFEEASNKLSLSSSQVRALRSTVF